jgi:hypothetical protein
VSLFRACVDGDDARHHHAGLEHAQFADGAAANELPSGRKQRLPKCFLQWVQSRRVTNERYASV